MAVRVCRGCKSPGLRRVNRQGFWETVVLPRLGLYPWECVQCRRRTLRRGDGHSRKPAGVAPPQG